MPINIPIGVCAPSSCKDDSTIQNILDLINSYSDDVINQIYKIESFEDMKRKIPNENYYRIFASLWSEKTQIHLKLSEK